MEKVYIYGLYSNVDDTIRYVGKTNNLEIRLKMHYSQRNFSFTHKNNWIKKVIKNGNLIKIKLIEEVLVNDWQEREKYWINYYKNSLTNTSSGGLGGSGRKYNISYEDCKNIILKLNIKSRNEWLKNKSNLPKNIPKNPVEYFGNDWISWGDFLSTNRLQDNLIKDNYLSYIDAKEWILENILSIKSRSHWKLKVNNNEIPYFIPNRPERFYKNRGWISWGDFLSNGRIANQNKKLLSYNDAKELVNKLNIISLKEYKIIQSLYLNVLPVHPHLTYKNKGYKTYDEFFRP
jgi:hypothetical protein